MTEIAEIGSGTTNSAQGPVDVVPHYQQESPEDAAKRRARQTTAKRKTERAERRVARRAKAKTLARDGSSTALEVVGLAAVSYGLFTQWPWLGIVAAGLSLILVGVLISLPQRRIAPPAPVPGDLPFPYSPGNASDGAIL